MVKDEWLDAEAAARYLRLPTRLIYGMVRGGQLPALQFPVRIRRQDLDACLERSRIKPGDLAHLDANKRRRSDDVGDQLGVAAFPIAVTDEGLIDRPRDCRHRPAEVNPRCASVHPGSPNRAIPDGTTEFRSPCTADKRGCHCTFDKPRGVKLG